MTNNKKPVAAGPRIMVVSRSRLWRRFMQQHPSFFRGFVPEKANFKDWRRH